MIQTDQNIMNHESFPKNNLFCVWHIDTSKTASHSQYYTEIDVLWVGIGIIFFIYLTFHLPNLSVIIISYQIVFLEPIVL